MGWLPLSWASIAARSAVGDVQWTTAVQRRWTHGPTRARGPGLASSNGPNRLQLLTQDPTEHGWPTSFWTGRRVAELIRRHFAVRYHPVYVLRLLGAMGF